MRATGGTELAPAKSGRGGARTRAPARLRPGGRSERVRETVARACLELLVEGKLDLAPATVAERSGVSRKTLYRWWPTRTDLLHNALTFHTRHLEPVDTGSWAGDVRALVEQLGPFLGDPVERAQNAIMASGLYPDFNRVMLDYYEPIQAGWRRVVERAIERGEVVDDVDPDDVVGLLISPLLVTTLFARRAPDEQALRGLVRLVLRATATAPETATLKAGETAAAPKRPKASAGAAVRARTPRAPGASRSPGRRREA